MRSEVKPEPVPPPKEWKMRKPCRPEHCSDCFLGVRKKMFRKSLQYIASGVQAIRKRGHMEALSKVAPSPPPLLSDVNVIRNKSCKGDFAVVPHFLNGLQRKSSKVDTVHYVYAHTFAELCFKKQTILTIFLRLVKPPTSCKISLCVLQY
jgi:hypothetical protein